MAESMFEREREVMKSELPADIRAELAAFRALRPFLSRCFSLNHDLNNPLAGILGYAEFTLTDGDNLTEEQRTSLDQIIECAERIQALIEEMSQVKSRIEEETDFSRWTSTT